ncbi:XrtA/PEP-CTERM system TPR-repeat protein PrsT [Rugamonas sp. CCM 8940]|uniref:XrtA/PEP-CTERM system TPR-repeat protein PrsT n=1 Tax=Rugamonas sp. CCM 8940 TaxID=2765359 RepID=UPI0018F77FE7|nr:XrtA/PEP-CTERM system TPR-repeat protein PrsT [Rugamonas sp. CCM 8940]MBJ7312446.1 PEP-CTERM system TPR-repeat protein PrsT [Rugamonas sp. CCM 8940]
MPRNTLRIARLTGAVLALAISVAACERPQSAAVLLGEAKQYLQKGDTKAALIQLKNAVAQSPDNAEARLLLGKLYNDIGDAASAEKEARRALALKADPLAAKQALGEALLSQGQFQKVLDESAGAAEQTVPALLNLRGKAYLGLRQPAQAKAAFEAALSSHADDADALIGLARHALGEQDLDAAARHVERAIAANPGNLDAWFFKGEMLRAQEQTAPALAAYDQIIQLSPNNAAARLMKAHLLIGKGDYKEAGAEIAAARKSTPHGLQMYYAQARLDYAQGRNKEAMETLQQILSTATEHAPTILMAGAVQFNLGSMTQAEQYLRKYLEIEPKSLYARKLLASTLLKLDRGAEATALLAPLLKEGSQDAQLYALAGEAAMKVKQYAKASDYLVKASTLAPQQAPIHTALGLSRLAQGDNGRAVRELEIANELDKKSSQAGILLAMTQLRLGEFAKAMAVAEALEKNEPDNPVLQNLKGEILLAQKDLHGARASFERALGKQAYFFPATASLAKLDMLERRPADAVKRLQALLAQEPKKTQAMTALASLAVARNDDADTANWLERAYNVDPAEADPAIRLAQYYNARGKPQKALTIAKNLQTSNPGNPEVIDLLAQTLAANGDQAGALEAFSQLAKLLPASYATQFRIAQLYMSMNNLPAAAGALKTTLALKPDFIEAHMALAALEVRRGKPEAAMQTARHLQTTWPKLPVGYLLEGDVLLGQAKPQPAVAAFEQAYARGKEAPIAIIKLHQAMDQAGQRGKADQLLAQWLAERPKSVSVRMYAATLDRTPQQAAAIQAFLAVLKIEPNNIDALNNLAWAYARQKDPRGLPYAEQAYRLAADNPAVLDTLGWILLEQGDAARGLPLLRKATTLASESADLRYHLAVGLFRSGDKLAAKQEITRLIGLDKAFADNADVKSMLAKL